MNELDKNQEVADMICRDFQWKGRQFHVGECVAILDGEVVAVASDLNQALQSLREIAPDPQRGMLVEIGKPVVDVIR